MGLTFSIMIVNLHRIHKLKKEPVQYLQRSNIIVKNSFIHRLLDLIFFIQSPVAPVEIIYDY